MSFEVAGQERISKKELESIERHTFILFLIGKGGSLADAENIMKAGNAILNSGGIALKVETSGKAFTPHQWKNILNTEENEKFFDAFVVLLQYEDNSIYTCGLHNIGMKDIFCNSKKNTNESVNTILSFLYYLLQEKPIIKSGETFSEKEGAPVFKIVEERSILYPEEDLFHNPYGIFRLNPVN